MVQAISGDQSARRAAAESRMPRTSTVASLIDNFNRLRGALYEICAINTELLRRREGSHFYIQCRPGCVDSTVLKTSSSSYYRIWSAWICVCGSDPVNTG